VKFSTIVGVYADSHSNPSTLPNNPTCLCLEHQDTDLPMEPFTFPINAVQAYFIKAHCALCGKYLGLPKNQAPEKLPNALDDLPMDRVAVLPDYEMRLLIAVLRRTADYFSRLIYDDIDIAAIVPNLQSRREILRRYLAWNCDLESFSENEAAGQEYLYWTYSSALAYFAFRLAPDIEQELCEREARW
jgi:hypothetical protein